ncbi:MAG: lytic transglycosylase domain-containing protein [Thermoanaerobacteraceae bacterium]|nr:lytic transglycosylase domain-containing protein [Thermoanaerobacteraceae bacterium]
MRVGWQPEAGGAGAKTGVSPKTGGFEAALAAAREGGAAALEPVLKAAAARFGLRLELLRAVAQAESGFNPRAVSRAGAQGVMQLMPATAQALGVRDPFDPVQNIFGGAAYLRSLLERFGGNEALALAAYNAGPGTVARYGGIPPYPETRAYVRKVLDLSGGAAKAAELQPDPPGVEGVSPGGETAAASTAAGGTEGPEEILRTAAVMWRYALAEYLLHAVSDEDSGAKDR